MNDPYDLARFVRAQEHDYAPALREMLAGSKRGHWMWFVFPQFDGLASSAMSRRYAIKSGEEARAYLAHPVLGPRLLAVVQAALGHADSMSATEILGTPDDLKLRSCATLFAHVSPSGSVFHRLLERFYPDGPDPQTLRLLGAGGSGDAGGE